MLPLMLGVLPFRKVTAVSDNISDNLSKMKVLLVVSVVLLAFGGIASAGTKSKCQVVGALRNQGVPDSEIRDCKLAKL